MKLERVSAEVAQASSLWLSGRHPCLPSFGAQRFAGLGSPADVHRLEACATSPHSTSL